VTKTDGNRSARDLARLYFTMWNTGDTSLAPAILAASWTDHSHPEVTGPAGVQEVVARTRAARPELRFDIETVFAEGDRVCVVGGVGAPDGTGLVSRLVWVFRAHGGKLTELWTYRAAEAAAVRPEPAAE
jgi:ketosteroid isomerase-like protein